MGLFRKRERLPPRLHLSKIRKEVLETIIEAAKDTYPKEFAGALKARDDTIIEVVLIPGTISGDEHAILKTYHLPTDFSIVGSVHSHPSPNATPSDADLQLFRTFGRIHIIMGEPYTMDSWKSYDMTGRRIWLEVV